MMKTAAILALTLAAGWTARADFSYATAPKSTGGPAAGGAGVAASKYYFKGNKMKIETSQASTILDFDAQTVTSINNGDKTYTVTPFSDLGKYLQDTENKAQAEVKETGQTKDINGYKASELLMTMAVEGPAGPQGPTKVQTEISMWLSPDVPGASELRSFYQRNSPKFPWGALGQGGNPALKNAMVEMQKRMAGSGAGVPVLQVIRAKAGGNAAQAAQMQQGMEQARARLEEMAKQGGPGADMAKQMLARMGAASSGGALFEMNIESSNFSTSAIPETVFAVPAGYRKTDAK